MSMSQDELHPEQDEIQKYLYEWMDRSNGPGLGVVVVSSTDILYKDGIGTRDRASNAPVTPETVFGIGSCSKSVTALGILQQVNKDNCRLTDPVSDYLPWMDVISGGEITIHELLSHSTGMPSDGYLSSMLTQLTGRGNEQPTLQIGNNTDFRNHITSFANERVADEGWQFYYNTGFTLLGKIIEECTGQSYDEYVTEHMLDPLDMSRSCFSRERFESWSNRITPYRLNNDTLSPDELAFDELLYAAGGLCSCATDMASYLQMLMGNGEFSGERVLPEDLLQEMTTGHTDWSDSIDGAEEKYGYGVFIQPFLDDTLVNHGGMMETTTAWFGYLKNADRGVFVTCNTTPDRSLGALGKTILSLTQDIDPDTVVPIRKLDKKIEPLIGTYEIVRGKMSATVTRHGSNIRIQADNPGWSQEYTATPTSLDPTDYEFQSVAADGSVVPISFDVSDEETKLRVGRWQLQQVSTTIN